MPAFREIFDCIGNEKVISKIYLKTRFHQIRMNQKILKRPFKAKCGQFEYFDMPIEAYNAPAKFQPLMNEIVHDYVGAFVMVYIDDLSIFCKGNERQYRHLKFF